MGNIISSCPCRKHRVGSVKEITLLMIGLDSAGKTCTAKHLLGECTTDAVPTVGFTSIQVRHGKFNVCVYDIGGGPKIRGIWKNYYALVHGVIFVVDASEPQRFEECKTEIRNVIKDERIAGKPILLLFNKQDLENAVNETELVSQLELEALVNEHHCPTRVEGTCAIYEEQKAKDPGIQEGFNWLIGHIGKEFDVLKERVERERSEQMRCEEKDRMERIERVRKLREERERLEKLNQAEKGIVNLEPNSCFDDGDSDVIIGNPFKPVNVIKAELEQKANRRNESSSSVRGVKVIHVSPTNSTEKKDSEIILQPKVAHALASDTKHREFHHTATDDQLSGKSQTSFTLLNEVDAKEKIRPRKTKKRFKNRIVPQTSETLSLIQPSSGDLPPLKSAVETLNGNLAVYNSQKQQNSCNGQVNWALVEH